MKKRRRRVMKEKNLLLPSIEPPLYKAGEIVACKVGCLNGGNSNYQVFRKHRIMNIRFRSGKWSYDCINIKHSTWETFWETDIRPKECVLYLPFKNWTGIRCI